MPVLSLLLHQLQCRCCFQALQAGGSRPAVSASRCMGTAAADKAGSGVPHTCAGLLRGNGTRVAVECIPKSQKDVPARHLHRCNNCSARGAVAQLAQ